MPILKINITNPQALELIRKIRSREIFIPIVAWLKKSKWYLISLTILFLLIIALTIGKKLSERSSVPVFVPQEIENVTPTASPVIKSDFAGLKGEINNLNTDLPDPFIPVFDNNIVIY